MFVLTYLVFLNDFKLYTFCSTLRLLPLLDSFPVFFLLAKCTQWAVCKWQNIFCRAPKCHPAIQPANLLYYVLPCSILLLVLFSTTCSNFFFPPIVHDSSFSVRFFVLGTMETICPSHRYYPWRMHSIVVVFTVHNKNSMKYK